MGIGLVKGRYIVVRELEVVINEVGEIKECCFFERVEVFIWI